MEYSGPASISAVETDLALSDDEDITDQHWPPMDLNKQCSGSTPWKPQVDVPPLCHPALHFHQTAHGSDLEHERLVISRSQVITAHRASTSHGSYLSPLQP